MLLTSLSYRPDEDENTILLERNFMAGDIICGVGWGIQFVLYIWCSTYLWSQRKERRSSIYLLIYITILFCIESVFVIDQARTVQVVYIDNRDFPGGPWQYFLASQNLPINVIFYATFFLSTFLSDCLVLWRCWVIWTSSGQLYANLVTVFPGMILVASFILGTLWTLQSSKPGLSLYSKLPLAYGTSYYTLSLGLNIILTVLITVRLLMYRQAIVKRLPGHYGSHYVSLATIIVESAALYSVFALAFLITYAVGNPTNQSLLAVAAATQQIATYLIIYRLAEGKAFGSSTMSEQTLTELSFAPPPKPSLRARTSSLPPSLKGDVDCIELSSPLSTGTTVGPKSVGSMVSASHHWLPEAYIANTSETLPV